MPHSRVSSKLDETIFKMLEDGYTFCEHPFAALVTHHTQGSPKREIHVMCAQCVTSKTVYADDFMGAVDAFRRVERMKFDRYEELKQWWTFFKDAGWKRPQDIIKTGDETMTSDYRRGVEDGTKTLYAGYPNAMVDTQTVNEKLLDRRKELLTKKVTKWVAVGLSPSNGKPYAQGYFQDTKESALANLTGDPSRPDHLGVFPIEIDVPID